MTEYERGFNEGFAAALARMERAPNDGHRGTTATASGGKKISVGFRPDQFDFISEYSVALGCSFGSAVRGLIDKTMPNSR